MTTHPERYPIAHLEIAEGKGEAGAAKTVADILTRKFVPSGYSGAQARVEGERVVIYDFSVEAAIRRHSGLARLLIEFAEKSRRRGNIPVKVVLYQSGEAGDKPPASEPVDVEILRKQHAGQVIRIEELEGRLLALRGEYDTLSGSALELSGLHEELRGEYARLQEAHQQLQARSSELEASARASQGRVLPELGGARNLVESLKAGSVIYRGWEGGIEKAIRASAQGLAERQWYLTEELREAQQTLRGKEYYQSEGGKTAFASLTKSAREALTKDWEIAESLVRESERSFPSLDMVIRVRSGRGWADFTIPYDGTATNEVAQAFYQAWENFLRIAESELGYKVVKYKISEKRPFVSVALRGMIDYQALVPKLYHALQDVMEKARLNLYPIPATTYISYEFPVYKKTETKKVRSEAAPKPRKPSRLWNALSDYVTSNFDVGSIRALCKEKGINYDNLRRLVKQRKIPEIAQVLGIPEATVREQTGKKK